MGDINQLTLLQRYLDLIQGPVLEVGSRDYGTTQDFRALLPGVEYTGVDMSAGKGVDVVVDMGLALEKIDAALGGRRFRTILCFSALEHCANPFSVAANITELLEVGGVALVSVPFCWMVHGYPSDYWRFTPAGVRALFPQLEFDEALCSVATCKPGDFRPLSARMAGVNLTTAAVRLEQHGRARDMLIRIARTLKALPSVFDFPYVHPPTMVNMIGRKSSISPCAPVPS